MGEVEEIQEKMKADMEAIKEEMATMMEAMMSVKKIMEANAVAIAATSVVAKVNLMSPSGINQMNHPTSDMVGKDLGSMDDGSEAVLTQPGSTGLLIQRDKNQCEQLKTPLVS